MQLHVKILYYDIYVFVRHDELLLEVKLQINYVCKGSSIANMVLPTVKSHHRSLLS